MAQKNKKVKIYKEAGIGYGAKDIYVLQGLEPVRKRPAMYIGSVGTDGLHHLIWEVIDNSIDEAIAGHCKHIEITLFPNNKIRVQDDGRGIPIDIHSQTKKSALETVLTMLHAGGKFGSGVYKVSGGLHGVGVSVVNALSKTLRAEVIRDGNLWAQEYEKGKVKSELKKIKKSDGSGTIITFEPDPEIFPEIKFDWKKILNHLREQAYLTKGVLIKIFDKRDEKNTKEYSFYFEGGIAAYIKFLTNFKPKLQEKVFYNSKEVNGIIVEVALRYVDEVESDELCFANNIRNSDGGSHLTGFRSALTRTLNDYAQEHGFIKENDEKLTGDDVREGLMAIISVKLKEPQFEGQTKSRLGNPEARTAVESAFSSDFLEFLEKNKEDARNILGKVVLSAKARMAAKAAKETVLRKGALGRSPLPGKLADCSNRKAEETELFIVEGDSAGGSAKQGRDKNFQAILPIRGKILNVEKARLDKILNSEEIKALILAIGTAIGEQFDITRARYHRIIIMTDADADGAHIKTLLLTLFYRYFHKLIDAGFIYIAQPPLYRINYKKDLFYVYSDEEKDKTLIDIKKKYKESEIKNINIQRYKGLGEMNPEQLWETTMNPQNRILKRVLIEDAQEANQIFDILMGKEVLPRKRFIQTHAKFVKNLDI